MQPQNEPQVEKAPSYKVPEGEEHLYHVELTLRKFDPNTGKPIGNSFVQKYNAKQWSTIYDAVKLQGYDINILYDPTKKK